MQIFLILQHVKFWGATGLYNIRTTYVYVSIFLDNW
jgi:hypothetical protein